MKTRRTAALLVGMLSLAMMTLTQGSASANPMQRYRITEPVDVEVVTATNPMQRLGVDASGGHEHGPVTPKVSTPPREIVASGVMIDQVVGR